LGIREYRVVGVVGDRDGVQRVVVVVFALLIDVVERG
jgi:hypothetical protein